MSVTQTLPEPSMARAYGSDTPAPVKLMAMVKSFGAAVRLGWNGESAVWSPNNVATFAPGLCAILAIAVAVSVGTVLPFSALANSVLQAVEPGPVELTHAARILASVLISA